MDLTIPQPLRPGDTVAIVTPSYPALGLFPHRGDRGAAYLRSLGLEVRYMPNATGVHEWVSATPEQRVADLHEAFADEGVKGIVCSMGGNHSNQLLPLLDHDLIARNPKIFQGYSDIIVLHWAIARHARLQTFYGPVFCGGMAEYPQVFDFTDRFLKAAWFGRDGIAFEPAAEWTDEFLEWGDKADLERARAMRPGGGWVTVREGRARGPLVGGCLETICWHLKGSDAWLDVDGAVWFLETSEEAPSPGHVEAYLVDLEQLGVFEKAAALIVGRPANYDPEDVEVLWRVIAEVTESSGIPVLANVDFGHTDPQLTLPIGGTAGVDAGARTFELER